MTSEDIEHEVGATAANWRTAPFSRWAFHHIRELLPVAEIGPAAAGDVAPLADAPLPFDGFSLKLPDGSALDLDGFLAATASDALVVMHEGRIVHEAYANGTTATTPHIFMSVTKAMVGLIAGILQRDGAIDLDAPASDYVPEIAASGYRGATLRQLIDMRAAVKLDGPQEHDYAALVGKAPADETGPSLHDLLPTLTAPAGATHGGPFSYISANTDLAGWAMERAAGRPFASLVSELLWKPMGAEHEAYVVVDREGSPWCAGGFCATARDFARVGELVLNDGRRGDNDIVPKAWIDDLTQGGDREAWRTGEWGQTFAFISTDMSYRAGWYSVHSDPKLLFAMGVHGQNLFIDRSNKVVVAKLSSQPNRIDARAIWLTHMAVPEFTRLALGG